MILLHNSAVDSLTLSQGCVVAEVHYIQLCICDTHRGTMILKSSIPSFQITLRMSNALKYGILALALTLFLIAILILAWKLHQYYKYRTALNMKDKMHLGSTIQEKKAEGKILVKSLAPSFMDIARKEQDSKIQLMQKEMEKLEEHLSPSSPSTESLDDVGSDSDHQLQKPKGKLRFSLLYDKKKLIALLKVIEAVELPEHSRDPFVKIKVFSRAEEQQIAMQTLLYELETKVVKNSRNPVFDEEFSWSVKDTQLSKMNLKFEIKDFDKYSRHTLIGEVRKSLKDLKSSETLEFCEDLQRKTKDIIGEVLVSLKCLPTSQKIEIGILKFKTSSMSSTQERDVYARIDVFSNHDKQKHQKSSLRAKSKVTVFNETFLFSLSDPVKTQCLILISLYETLVSGRHLIGQTTLGNQKTKAEDDHWELMLQSIRQPIAKWHPLFL